MGYVKLDKGILDSTVWIDRDERDVFITALLMADYRELKEPRPQLDVLTGQPTGYTLPPGWYGLIEAAGTGIVARALVPKQEGLQALKAFGEPEVDSRSQEHEGRRLVRINGAYVVLNFEKYRNKDNTGSIRQHNYRMRKRQAELAAAIGGEGEGPEDNPPEPPSPPPPTPPSDEATSASRVTVTQKEKKTKREKVNTSLSDAGAPTAGVVPEKADPRYKPFLDAWYEDWKANNNGKVPGFGDADGKNLKLLLAENKSMTLDDWRVILRNRRLSPINKSAMLRTWVVKAQCWLSGTNVNDFGNAVGMITRLRPGPVVVNGNSAEYEKQRQQQMEETKRRLEAAKTSAA